MAGSTLQSSVEDEGFLANTDFTSPKNSKTVLPSVGFHTLLIITKSNYDFYVTLILSIMFGFRMIFEVVAMVFFFIQGKHFF